MPDHRETTAAPVSASPVRPPNWTALRNAANRARFDKGLTIDAISEGSGLARSTVVMLLTGENTGGRIATWHALAQGLRIDWPGLAASLDDPDYDQPDILNRDGGEARPSLPTIIRQITSIMPPERAERLSNSELHKLVADMGYEASPDAVRIARWRIDKATRA